MERQFPGVVKKETYCIFSIRQTITMRLKWIQCRGHHVNHQKCNHCSQSTDIQHPGEKTKWKDLVRIQFKDLIAFKSTLCAIVFLHPGLQYRVAKRILIVDHPVVIAPVSSSTDRKHPPVEVSLSRTLILYPGDSCWHCFLTSHWIGASHNWILRGSMQCKKGKKSSITTAWLLEIDNRSVWSSSRKKAFTDTDKS